MGDYNLYRYVGNDPLDLTDPMGLGYEDHMVTPDQATRDAIVGAVSAYAASAWVNFKSDTQDMLSHPEYLVGPGNIGMAGARGPLSRSLLRGLLGEASPKVNMARQGKHIVGHENFISGRSELTAKASDLAKMTGKGEQVVRSKWGFPAQKNESILARRLGITLTR